MRIRTSFSSLLLAAIASTAVSVPATAEERVIEARIFGEQLRSKSGLRGYFVDPTQESAAWSKAANNFSFTRCKVESDWNDWTGFCENELRNGNEIFPTDFGYVAGLRFDDYKPSYQYYIVRADSSAKRNNVVFNHDMVTCGTWNGYVGYRYRTNVFGPDFCAWGGSTILWLFPHLDPGDHSIVYLEAGAVVSSTPLKVVAGSLAHVSGSGQQGVVNQKVPAPIVVAMKNADGEPVVFPIDSERPDQTTMSIDFTLKHEQGATGGLVTDEFGNTDPSSSDPLSEPIENSADSKFRARVQLGANTGTYEVWASSNFAAAPAIATISAADKSEPPDSNDEQQDEDTVNAENTEGDPIFIASGANVRSETDYESFGLSAIDFKRTYVSNGTKSGLTRTYWSTTYDRRVVVPTTSNQNAYVRRPDGSSVKFSPNGGGWSSAPYERSLLVRTPTGWTFTNPDKSTEVFDANGQLKSITDLRGRTQTLTYSNKGVLTRVSSNTGEFLDVVFNANKQISSIKDNTGRTWGYTYDNWFNLKEVKYPNGLRRYYEYNDEFDPRLLTSVQMLSATGVPSEFNRYVEWTYDAQGRATSSAFLDFQGNKERSIAVSYGTDGSRTVTDSAGRTALYQTAQSGNRTFIQSRSGARLNNPGAGQIDRTYDAAMNVTRAVKNGLTMDYGAYDAKGQAGYRVVSPGSSQSRRTDYSYDSRFIGKPTVITEPSVAPGQSRVTEIQYDAMGNATRVSVSGFTPSGTAVSRIATMQYGGPFGQISQIDGPRADVADVTRFEYDATTKRLVRVIDPNGIVVRDAIKWTSTGKIASENRSNGLALVYTYEPGTDLLASLKETSTSGNRTTTWTYTQRRQVASISFVDGSAPAQRISFTYSPAGDLKSATSYTGNYSDGPILISPESVGFSKGYDNLGNEVSSNTHGSWSERIVDEYNRVDRLIRANNELDFDFASDGKIERFVDGKSQETTFAYDDLRRLTQVLEPGAVTTQLGYDVHGALTSVRDANNAQTNYVLDDLGNLLEVDSPDSGTTTFVHDAAGNVVRKTDARGQLTTYTYDAGSRVRVADRPGTQLDDTYVYDTCLNGRGLLCAINRGDDESVSFEYDNYRRVSKQTNRVGTVSYVHNARNDLKKIVYPSGRSIEYTYDLVGRPTSVLLIDGNLKSQLAKNITSLGAGPLTGWTYGNGVVHSRQYDAQLWPTSVSHGNLLNQTLSAFDGNGNPTAMTVDGVPRTFGYNTHDALTDAAGPWGSLGYEYDAVGNRTSSTQSGVTEDYLYEAQSNRIDISTPWDFTLDASGNTIEKVRPDGSGYRFAFNAENRLSEARDLQSNNVLGSYAYNPLGQRVAKAAAGVSTRYVYGLSGELLAELSASGAVQREYVWLAGIPLATLGSPDGATPPSVVFDQIVDNPALSSMPECFGFASVREKLAEGGNYLANTASITCNSEISWITNVPTQGVYDIFVKWMGSDATTISRYMLDGKLMDLNTIGATKGSWLKLATVAKSPGQLRVIQTSSFANGTIRADAIRVQLVGQDAQDHSRVAYVHADHLGTPLAMSDKNQRVIWRAEYEPFGAAIANTDPDADGQNVTMNLRFPGQYFDAESGLHYNYFRDYDPDLGRYIESDPIGLIAGVNTYAYVNGNPLAQVDSLGLWASQKTRYVHQWAWQNTVGRGQNLGVNMVVEHALAFADAPQFQDKAHSHQHAMRNDPNQSVAAGATATADFVRSQYDRAWNLLEAGNKSAALHEFGLALHALQDATSPAHEGFQVWTGEETRWEVVQHVRQEIHDPGPGSALYEITEEAWNALNERRYPDKPW